MSEAYSYIEDLAREVEIPQNGILSRAVYEDEQVKVLVFAFDRGQELSEHTASKPAIVHFIQGEARLTLGDDVVHARAGAWIRMAPGLAHSLYAETPVIMLLYLMKTGTSLAAE